jgi:small subunit ribosomal protein S21
MQQSDGFFRRMKRLQYHEKSSARRVREKAESVRRIRKLNRKRFERDGL